MAVSMFVAIILSLIGGKISNITKIFNEHPSNVAIIPKTMQKLPWYLRNEYLCIICGLIIASGILPEFYKIQFSMWNGKIYFNSKYLFIVIITTLFISGCISISITFFRFQKEHHKWHWMSFLAPASSGIIILFYSICFYISNEKIINLKMYILWIVFISLFISFACGGIGFLASNLFVRYIFSNLKID